MPDELQKPVGATAQQWAALFRVRLNPHISVKTVLILTGLFLTPITLIGALIGYVRSYNRIMRPEGHLPDLYELPPIVRYAMIIGAIAMWLVFLVVINLFKALLAPLLESPQMMAPFVAGMLLVNSGGTAVAFIFFRRWRTGMNNMMLEKSKFGTARFAKDEELQDYIGKTGLYLGSNYTLGDNMKGHILTVAGTRGGKGTNLIIPNLLGYGVLVGSWVVIDPKAENAAITARFQRRIGNNVVILNPWGLLEENVGPAQSYNPLDLVRDKTSIHLIDDIQVIAEMIVPIDKNDKDRFFTDNARAIVAGLLLHLVTTEEKPVLTTLWRWVRLAKKEWDDLLADMAGNDDAVNGEAVNRAAYEILKLQAAGDKTFGSIIATVLQSTDFLKSLALQKSLESGFDSYELANGRTTVYVIIPADKLQSHARWLRLITITTLRAVVRKPDKRVTFLLDEFAALGYLGEIQNALSTYAGFNITVWPILQSLIQLKAVYGDIWETFIANATIRQFFTVNDNFTAQYVSDAIGNTSNVFYTKSWWGIDESFSNQRPLVTPDEVRRYSGNNIFAFFGEKQPVVFSKRPYYEIQAFTEADGSKVYDSNPYLKTQT